MVLSLLRNKMTKIVGGSSQTSSTTLANRTPDKVKTDTLSDPLAKRILQMTDLSKDRDGTTTVPLPADNKALLEAVKSRIDGAQLVGLDIEACLDRVTFSGPVSQAEVLECLRVYGLAIFPSIYDAKRLSAIELEYHDLISNGADFARVIDEREDTPANSFGISLEREALPAERFPEIVALFASRSIEDIGTKLFAGQSFDFNKDLYVQWTDYTDVPASGALHWDKQLTLKSWLYVTDATEGFGAMRAGVGTAAWTRYIREDAMFDGVPYRQIVNQVEEENIPLVSTGGPAGTFFLFVTDTAHGATAVEPGKRRNIIRARSRPHRVRQWAAWANRT